MAEARAERAAHPGAGADTETFIKDNTALSTPPLVPEVRLHLASEILPIWHQTEEELTASGLPPPFWAFAWAGGQALARYILDNPGEVRGRRVFDFGSGSGLVAIAAAQAGGTSVTASDIDAYAVAAVTLNARANRVHIEALMENVVGRSMSGFDVILAADICYEQPLAGHVTEWLSDCARAGISVLIGDPGRTYLPRERLVALETYAVETTRELEDRDVRRTTVWRFAHAEP